MNYELAFFSAMNVNVLLMSCRGAFQLKTPAVETVHVLEESIAVDFQGHNHLLIRLLPGWTVIINLV